MTIDGKDLYTEWGCKLLEGSFDDLLKYPKRKAVKYNNWAEADGIDPDLSVVEFEPKTVKLKFLMKKRLSSSGLGIESLLLICPHRAIGNSILLPV